MRTDPDVPIFTCLSALGVSRFTYNCDGLGCVTTHSGRGGGVNLDSQTSPIAFREVIAARSVVGYVGKPDL